MITRKELGQQLESYLQHQVSLKELVDWAEEVMREGEFEQEYFGPIREIVGRLGLADVRAFGLTWEDCEAMLKQLGYEVKIEVIESS